MTSPFFTPFMLDDLKLGCGAFTVLVAGATLARPVIAPWLGDVAARVGLTPLMVAGAVGIAVTPVFWALFRSFSVLFAAQLFSGAAWAAYELATFQLLIASAGDRARLRFLGVAACLSTTGGVIGGVVGGLLLRNVSLGYDTFFAWGAVVRAVPLVVLVGYVITQRDLVRSTVRGLIFRLETVRPGAGAVARVVFQPVSLARRRRQQATRHGRQGP